MPDARQYHVDGDLVPAEGATVSVRDRGFRYGDGVFETLRVYGGDLFAWDAHAARLDRAGAALDLPLPSAADLRDRITATVDANGLDEAIIRLSVTRGAGGDRLTPPADPEPTVVVVPAACPRGGPHGDVWDAPATACVAASVGARDTTLPGTKTANYLRGVLARREAREGGHDEALLTADGAIVEGAAANLFVVRNNRLVTPNLDGPVLPGVTRRIVLDCAREVGLSVAEPSLDDRPLTPARLRTADEAFLTNTSWEIRPLAAIEIDGDTVRIGGGPTTERLRAAFADRVADACYRD